MVSNDSGRYEPFAESGASLNLPPSRFLPAPYLEVDEPVTADSESPKQNPLRFRAPKRSLADLPPTSGEKYSTDNLDTPTTRHRHRRKRIDHSSNTNRSSTPSHAGAARPKKPATNPPSSEYPISGFFPRLTRILEHRDEDTTSRLSGSPVNTNQEPKSRPRKHNAINVDRERTARYRTYFLQQELSNLSNPSLSSLFSTLTTSSGSSGSSTVTQKSYDRSVGVRRKRRLRHRSRREETPSEGRNCSKLEKGRRIGSMDSMDYQITTIEEESATQRCSNPLSKASLKTASLASRGFDGGLNIEDAEMQSRHSSQANNSHDKDTEIERMPRSVSRAPSLASSSFGDGHSEETLVKSRRKPPSRGRSAASSSESSSEADDRPPKLASTGKINSFPPSPSSNLMSKNVWKRQETFNSDSGISVSSSPEFHTRPEQEPGQQSEPEENDSDDESSDSSDEDEEEEEEAESSRPSLTAQSSSAAIPNASAHPRALMDNDPLVQRLQEQEEELRAHMDLHSPQPKRKFRPPVTSPCEPSPALPLFDSRGSSTAPAHFALTPQTPDLHHNGNASYLHPQYPHAMPPPPPFHPDPTRRTVAGYELLAEKLASQSQENERGEEMWTPVYRRFAQLNHRILLHLQDEISLLEEELRMVDEGIAQRAEMMEGEVPPASRRMEMRYGNEPYHRRTELLGRIFQKLGQYNQALASYASASKNYTPAQSDDISAYRAWMDEHEPVDEPESRFLGHEKDLMALKKEAPLKPAAPANSPDPREEKVLLIAALLIPPIAISLVPGIIAKMVIMAILSFSGLIILNSQPRSVAIPPIVRVAEEGVSAREKEPNIEQCM
ncbi:hypothetical protein FKW77_005884 [Venturia effusa]|uniref:DUF6594 domain-containing protein n=1 Tax=Venturia effusa TaxID=50376 RepID=A0A517L7F3_9PEZI|nr:hypothetical protein FKW77_005884 [Venturia effusa]